MSNNFRAFTAALSRSLTSRGTFLDVYDLLTVADEVKVFIKADEPDLSDPDQAMRCHAAMVHMRDGKRINAIKELRSEYGWGLKRAKEATEDKRLMIATGYVDAWNVPYTTRAWGGNTPQWYHTN